MLMQTFNRPKQHNVLRTSHLHSPSEGMRSLLPSLIKEQNLPACFCLLTLLKEHPNSHKLHTKRQIISVAVIKSNIYNIFYKIYQCVFYVIYKLAVLLESMILLESFDV